MIGCCQCMKNMEMSKSIWDKDADLIENVSTVSTKYTIRFKRTDGFIEYGLNKSGLAFNYIDHKSPSMD